MNESVFGNIKKILKTILPQTVKAAIKKVRILALRGSRFYCPVCEKSFRKFYEFGVKSRPNAMCPGCGSLERHRLLLVALCNLQDKGLIQRVGRLLHVAPEPCLTEKFRQKYDYLSIDLDGERAMMAMDITAMTFEDESFDAIVCNHVLEHIPDDKKAMKELYRVLKPRGWASIQVPIKGDITQEDLAITDAKERLRLYGQEDHVRYYGRDFTNRLKKAGFNVVRLSKTDLFDSAAEEKRASVVVENEVVLARRL
jgi:predicted SAM-dependent methyltransferase